MNHMQYQATSGTRINERGLGKPNEDLLLVDRENHIFILLDGITRVHREYADLPGKSAALDVGEIFLQTAYAYMLAHLEEPDTDGQVHRDLAPRIQAEPVHGQVQRRQVRWRQSTNS